MGDEKRFHVRLNVRLKEIFGEAETKQKSEMESQWEKFFLRRDLFYKGTFKTHRHSAHVFGFAVKIVVGRSGM